MGLRQLARSIASSPSVSERFRTIDPGTRQALADIESPLVLSLSALCLAKERFGIEALTSCEISLALEEAGVALSIESIRRALAHATGSVCARRSLDHQDISYAVMTAGERKVPSQLRAGALQVLRFDGNTPRTARLRVGEVLGSLTSPVSICDPYLGFKTLQILEEIPKSTSVRFLTIHTTEAPGKLQSALRDFSRERPEVTFRAAQPSAGLHDRYILASSMLLLLGHGLKDVGTKESFVIVLDHHLVPDLILEIHTAFATRWTAATPLCKS